MLLEQQVTLSLNWLPGSGLQGWSEDGTDSRHRLVLGARLRSRIRLLPLNDRFSSEQNYINTKDRSPSISDFSFDSSENSVTDTIFPRYPKTRAKYFSCGSGICQATKRAERRSSTDARRDTRQKIVEQARSRSELQTEDCIESFVPPFPASAQPNLANYLDSNQTQVRS